MITMETDRLFTST